MTLTTFKVASDFHKFPSGRTFDDSPWCGQALREVLVGLLAAHDSVLVELDGTLGYSSSFLQKAFSTLLEETGLTKPGLQQKLKF